MIAFGWIGWVSLTVLFFGLLVYTALEHKKGHRDVWATSAYEYPFGTTTHNTSGAGISSKDAAQPQMAAVSPAVADKERNTASSAPVVATV